MADPSRRRTSLRRSAPRARGAHPLTRDLLRLLLHCDRVAVDGTVWTTLLREDPEAWRDGTWVSVTRHTILDRSMDVVRGEAVRTVTLQLVSLTLRDREAARAWLGESGEGPAQVLRRLVRDGCPVALRLADAYAVESAPAVPPLGIVGLTSHAERIVGHDVVVGADNWKRFTQIFSLPWMRGNLSRPAGVVLPPDNLPMYRVLLTSLGAEPRDEIAEIQLSPLPGDDDEVR